MSNIAYKLVVETNEREVHSEVLNPDTLVALVELKSDLSFFFDEVPNDFEWEDKYVRLLGYLAQSAYSEVRYSVAGHNSINEDTLELLAKDEDVEVRRRIADCSKFRAWATEEIVIDYIESDVECARSIAINLDEFTKVDKNTIAEALSNHSDTEVRRTLAGSWNTPERILKQLLTDPEPCVRSAARHYLDNA